MLRKRTETLSLAKLRRSPPRTQTNHSNVVLEDSNRFNNMRNAPRVFVEEEEKIDIENQSHQEMRA